MNKLDNNIWLQEPTLQNLLKILEEEGHEARVIGGAVRNALLEVPIDDIDIATTRTPDNTILHLKKHKIRAIPTGIDHGTITAILDERSFEITTLRADVNHDGRHATVVFSTDWLQDAKRRDFTINAISVDRKGGLYDPENGLEDIETRHIRFIGDPDQRIHEDYLRILRFFRIYAHYGDGQPDRDALKACARNHEYINQLSSERIWSETKKLLSANHITQVLNWMRVSKVLTTIIPESEKWGISAIPHLMACEAAYQWRAEPFMRLMAIIPPQLERITSLIKRLKLSNKEADRLHKWVHIQGLPIEHDTNQLAKTLYHNDQQAILDYYRLERVRMLNAGYPDEEKTKGLELAINFIQTWEKPQLPVSGKDLINAGFEAGETLGKALKNIENHWIENEFKPSKEELLNLL